MLTVLLTVVAGLGVLNTVVLQCTSLGLIPEEAWELYDGDRDPHAELANGCRLTQDGRLVARREVKLPPSRAFDGYQNGLQLDV